MKVAIANPIYDVVFKYLMEDNEVAKLLISSIIDEDIIHLEVKPQEYTVEKVPVGSNSITVYRLDFAAQIKTSDGHKLVLIEMQKATFPSDIVRFRRYLGKQYANENNAVKDKDGNLKALPIYAIYFLGNELGICRTPVLKVSYNILDVGTQKIVEAKSDFIELLNHKSWIVQISCMQEPRRNELELLLSVFDQNNITSDHHILNVHEEDFPEKYRPLLRRLKQAASEPEVKEQMTVEDEFLDYLKNWMRSEISKMSKEADKKIDHANLQIAHQKQELTKKDEELEQKEKELEQKEKELEQKEKELGKKDEVIGNKDKVIENKDKELLRKDEELEDIRKKNEALRLLLIQSGLL